MNHSSSKTAREAAIRRLKEDSSSIPGGEPLTVRFYQPEDGYGVSRLMYSVYGDGYPIDTFYVPEQLTEANRDGRIRSVIAATEGGEVVAHAAFYRSSPPNPDMYEFGLGLTLPAYRACGAFERCTGLLFSLMEDGAVKACFGEGVCNHTITQKMAAPIGLVETALEVDLMPAGTYEKEQASDGRVTCLMCFRIGADRLRPLCIPDCYRDELRFMMAGISVERELIKPEKQLFKGESVLSTELFSSSGVCRCTITEPGQDLAARLQLLESELRSQGYALMQCYVPLGTSAAAATVDLLRKSGFFLGGFLPEWFGDDGLLMQKLFAEPGFDTIKLYAERAKRILAMVRADWQRSREESFC